MAYYTDYETIVSYSGSTAITNSSVSNALADMLVSHAGCTLSCHAAVGTASSETNYAEVIYNGIYIRFYGSSTLGSLYAYFAYSANGTSITSQSMSFYYVSNSYVDVKIRFYNLKSGGFLFQYYSSSDSWDLSFMGGPCARISTGATLYFVSLPINVNSYVLVADGLSLIYYFPGPSYLGAYDVYGDKQVLTQLFVSSEANTFAANYIPSNVYSSTRVLITGIVQIGSRYFFIVNSYFAIELNS